MSNQDPTPASPAAVCERLKQALGDFEVFAQADGAGDYVECRINKDDLTAALALISQGEKERERLNAENNDMAYRLGEATRGLEWQPTVKDLRAQLAAATERAKLWRSLAVEGTILAVRYGVSIEQEPFAEDFKNRVEQAARAQPTPESK
jgi:hypothetical protein